MTLGLKYYADNNDAQVSDMLRQAIIKTENHDMDFSEDIWKAFPDTGRITGAYIIFYQGRTIDHGTHVPGTFSQSSAKSQYNETFTARMALAHFRMLIHELFNKDTDIVPQEAPLVVLDGKSDMCMANNGKDTKHTRHNAKRMPFVSNG